MSMAKKCKKTLCSVEGGKIDVILTPVVTGYSTWDCPHRNSEDCQKDEEGRCPIDCPMMDRSAR